MFLDSDDFFDVNLVFSVVEHAIKTDADITVFQYKLYYDCQSKLSTKIYGIHTNRRAPFNLFELRTGKFEFTNIAVWNKLYKTDFIHKKNLTFKSHSAINDVFFSWSALICAEKIALCRYVGTYYRVNSGSSVTDNLIRTSECFLTAFREINDFVKTCGMWDALRDDIISTEKKQAEEFLARLKRDSKLYRIEDRFELEMKEFFS